MLFEDCKRSVIIGLDISTSCSGFAILDFDGELIDSGYIELNKKKKGDYVYPHLLDRATVIEGFIDEWSQEYDVRKVYIESPAQGGFNGKTSANTLSKLIQFNGIVTYMSYKKFNLLPEHINVRSARKICGIKNITGANSSHKNKVNVANFFVSKYPSLILEKNRNGNIKKQFLDMTDAICIAFAGYLSEI